jgi:hypothetical protein
MLWNILNFPLTVCFLDNVHYSNNSNKIASSSIILIYHDEEDKLNIKISLFGFCIVISIMVLKDIFEKYFIGSYFKSLDFWMLELVVISFIIHKMFNFKIHRHHKLVIYINMLICLPIKIIVLAIRIFFQKDENYKDTYTIYSNNLWFVPLGFIFYFLIITSNSYTNSKIKYYMDLKYISPAKLLLIYGIIGTLISSIIGIIASYISFGENKMKIFNVNREGKYYLENIYSYFIDLDKDALSIIFESLKFYSVQYLIVLFLF